MLHSGSLACENLQKNPCASPTSPARIHILFTKPTPCPEDWTTQATTLRCPPQGYLRRLSSLWRRRKETSRRTYAKHLRYRGIPLLRIGRRASAARTGSGPAQPDLAPSKQASGCVTFRAPYLLSQFVVDAGPSWPWAGLPRPGLGMGREGLEEKPSSRGMGAHGGHGRYADVPGEVSEQVFRCDASERLKPIAEIVHHSAGVTHVVERAGI